MYGVAPSYATSSKDRTSEFHAALGKFTTTPRPASTTQRPTSAHADFTRRAQSVAQALGVTTAKLDRLSQLARRKTLFDDRPVEISELTYIIKHDIAGLNRQLAELQQMSGSSRGGRANRTDEHRSNMLTMLQSSLANTTTSFQDILEVRTQNMKASKDRSEQFFSGPPTLDMQRSRSPLYTLARGQTGSTLPAVRDTPVPTSALHNRGATAATMSDEKSMNMAPNDHGFLALDMMESGGIQQQQLLLNEFENQQSGYLQQRSNAIESIESTISELGQIFGQLAQMVAQQGETVQRIDDDVLHVSDNVEGARRELLKYYASIANNRWLMLKIFGVLIVFFLPSMATAIPVGEPIPPNVPHAVSVSLPHWQDIVDYEEGRLGNTMQTGYPRFFIHRSIQKLAQLMEIKFARFGESSMLFPTAQHASQCRDFMRAMERRRDANAPDVPIRIVRFSMHPHSKAPVLNQAPILLYIVLFPESLFALAKAFWQHTGVGITSRMAEGCLRILEHNESLLGDCGDLNPQTVASRRGGTSTFSGVPARGGGFGRSRYASRMPPLPARSDSLPARTKSPELITESHEVEKEEMTFEHAMFVEERYGRNLPSSLAARAKDALRRRIAGTLVGEPGTDDSHLALRKVTGVTENDVFLFPCGMAAIFHAHQTIMLERTLAAQSNPVTREGALQALRTMDDPSFVFGPFVPGKAICFGFTYTDTLKVLQKWGPGCHFFGHGTDGDLDKLEALLASQPADEPKIMSLFCEFPSNPLLRSPDLKRIRALADTYGFSVVIDETIGNFVNVEVLPYADMVVSSLTKIFSGDCNVMGGSLVLNPRSPRAKSLRAVLEANYQDTLWPEDAIFLERNSRNFIARIAHIDRNAETVSDYLREHSQAGGCADSVVEDVFYPKYVTRHHYDAYRREHPYVEGAERSGFGGLISVQFSSIAPAQAFYNNLAVFKGPSLGTNCTLACPYTLLAHYSELDWAARMNVSNNLVRVSVGLEDTDQLLQVFTEALAAAEAAA